MKKLITLAIALALTAASVPVEAGFGIKVKGGYSYISYGDYNDWVEESNSGIPPEYPTYEKLHWIPEVSAEFTFPLLPSFSGSIGIGYISGKTDYNVNLGFVSYSYVHRVKSTPIFLNVYWEPPLKVINPFVYGGVGFYRTILEFDESLTSGGQTEGGNSELDKWGFGLQAGGGVSILLAPTVSFDVGVQGRWADISGFKGTTTDLDGNQEEVYLGKGEVERDNIMYPYYGPATKDSGLEEASVNLSAFTIFIGLTVGF